MVGVSAELGCVMVIECTWAIPLFGEKPTTPTGAVLIVGVEQILNEGDGLNFDMVD